MKKALFRVDIYFTVSQELYRYEKLFQDNEIFIV